MAYEPYKSQTPPGSTGVVNYFESFNKENEQKNRAQLGMPQQGTQKPLVDWNQMTQGYQPNVEVPNPNKEYIPAPSAPLPNGIQAPSAESAFQQSFPRPKDSIQQAANKAAPTPQLTQPKQAEYLYQQVRTDDNQNQPTFNADDYKDGTADGLGRNFLKTITEPKTEEDYAKDNETKKRILALGNALRHIGNIVYTSKGAPAQIFNDPVAMQEQKYQAERNKRQSDAYREAQSQYQKDKLQGDQDYKKFLLNLRMGDLDRQNRRDQAAAERNKRLDEDMKQNRADRLQMAKDNLDYRKENDKANREQKDKLAQLAASVRLQLKSMGGSKSSSSSSSGGGGGGKGYATFLGVTYKTKADYDRAVVSYCRKNGIPLTYKKTTYIGNQPSGSTQTNRTIAGLAAQAEEHYAKQHAFRRGGNGGKGGAATSTSSVVNKNWLGNIGGNGSGWHAGMQLPGYSWENKKTAKTSKTTQSTKAGGKVRAGGGKNVKKKSSSGKSQQETRIDFILHGKK